MTVPEEKPLPPPEGAIVLAAPTIEPASIYVITEMDRELRQCEIITGLIQYVYEPTTTEAKEIPHPYAIILAQDVGVGAGGKGQGNHRP